MALQNFTRSRADGSLDPKFSSGNTGNLSDIAHASLLPGGCDPFIDRYPDRIISTHVSDNDLVLDDHLPVGEGDIDFKAVFKRLIDINFKGTLNIELPRSNEDRLLSKKRLEPILDELGVLETALQP